MVKVERLIKQRLFPFLLLSLLIHALLLLVVAAPTVAPPPALIEVQLSAPGQPRTFLPPPSKQAVQTPTKRLETPRSTPPTPATPALRPNPSAPEAEAKPALQTSPAAATPAVERAPVGSDSGVIFDAAYLHNPVPEYPAQSRRLEEEGVVKLNVRVGTDGRALTVDLASSSGFKRLDKAAEEAVRQWRFVPAKRAGQAIEGSVVVPVRFTLNQ